VQVFQPAVAADAGLRGVALGQLGVVEHRGGEGGGDKPRPDRVAGVQQALAAAGLALAPQHLVEHRYALADAREGFRALMAATPRPTAVLCGNDVLAFGALLEAQRMGIAVPGELSIVGFDDLEMARHIQPGWVALAQTTSPPGWGWGIGQGLAGEARRRSVGGTSL